MNLSAPTQPIFLISLILAVLAVLGVYMPILFISGNAFWVAIIVYVVLLVDNVAKGLRQSIIISPALIHFAANTKHAIAPMKREAKASLKFIRNLILAYEKAIPAAIKSAKPIAGTIQVFFLMNSDINFLQIGTIRDGAASQIHRAD